MRRKLSLIGAVLVLASLPALAQQATPPYGSPITLEQAKKVIAAAEAEAQKNNWPVVITVVDSGSRDASARQHTARVDRSR